MDSFTLSLDVNDELLQKFLKPVWEKIPASSSLTNVSLGNLTENLSANAENMTIVLGESGKELAQIQIDQVRNRLYFNWDLSELKVKGLVRLDFLYEKWGLSLTHTEFFNVELSSIKNAKTHLEIGFFNQKLSLNILGNEGFHVEVAKIYPAVGSSNFLNWLFEKVISEDKINDYVKDNLNKQLANLINSEDFFTPIEDAINGQIFKALDKLIKIDEISSHFFIKPTQFMLTQNKILASMNIEFNYDALQVHPCAKNIQESLSSSRLKDLPGGGLVHANFATTEQMAMNFLSFIRYEEDGKVVQPLLCMGHGEYSEDGTPVGELISIKLLLRNLQAKLWASPMSAPELAYDLAANLITAKSTFLLDLKGIGMPHLRLGNNKPLELTVRAVFSIVVEENGGLSLKIESLKILDFKGRAQIKWFAFTPYIEFPLEDNIQMIEKEIIKMIESELVDGKIVLLKEGISIGEELKFGFKTYDLNEKGHQFLIEVKSRP